VVNRWWKDVDWESKILSVTKSYNCRMRETKSTKAGTWRQVPMSNKLIEILRTQYKATGQEQHVFERAWQWERGLQAKVLRTFCYIHGLPSIKFHTLRACFATQMLRQGVEAAKVMKICGWKELKTMQHYVRLAGIKVCGATEALEIFDRSKERSNPLQNHGASLELDTSQAHDFATTQV